MFAACLAGVLESLPCEVDEEDCITDGVAEAHCRVRDEAGSGCELARDEKSLRSQWKA